MTDQDFQRIVLEKLSSLEGKITFLEENQSHMEENLTTDLSHIEENLTTNLSHLEENLTTNLSHIEENLTTNLSRIEAKVDLIASELPQDIIGILKLMNGKLDCMATKEDISRVEDILDVLAARTTRQEAEILGLKRAK